MVPMRSVPHRVVVLLGLDDEMFPRVGGVDGDDILARDPVVGERDLRSEDRQLLLDAVMSAGDHLILLYTGADPVTGVVGPPAMPLSGLLDVLQLRRWAEAIDGVLTSHPLQSFDKRNFAPISRSASTPQRWPAPWPLSRCRSRTAVSCSVALPETTDGREPRGPASFLDHPMRGFLRQRLGVPGAGTRRRHRDSLHAELDGLGDLGDG